MNRLTNVLKPGPILLLLALMAASAVGVGLILLRILWTGHWNHGYLVWNLFLAWIPLGFALVAYWFSEQDWWRDWRFLSASAAWLLFFPNAPYICTDLVHLSSRYHSHFWVDLILLLLFALIGLLVGFASLYLMQSLVVRRLGRIAGWLFVAAVAAVSGWGVFIGRVMRWNSWDVVLNPIDLFTDLARWLSHVPFQPTSATFPMLFAMFIFITYLMVYALMRLNLSPTSLCDNQTTKCP